jgi:hypothetical protein
MPPACRALAWDIGAGLVRPETLLREYLDTVVDAAARQALQRRASPLRQQMKFPSTVSATWLRAAGHGHDARHAGDIGRPGRGLPRLGGTGN